MANKLLVGKKAISDFVGRSWGTVKRWIREEDFPQRRSTAGGIAMRIWCMSG
jgi:hypothetical protein